MTNQDTSALTSEELSQINEISKSPSKIGKILLNNNGNEANHPRDRNVAHRMNQNQKRAGQIVSERIISPTPSQLRKVETKIRNKATLDELIEARKILDS